MKLEELNGMTDAQLDETLDRMCEPYAQQAVELGLATGADMDEDLVRRLTDEHRQRVLRADPAANISPTCDIFQVFDSPEQAIKNVKGLTVSNALYGQHDSNWLYNCLFFRTEFGLVEETDEIMSLVALVPLVGWFWIGKTATIVTRRPSQIHLLTKATDDTIPIRELHNPDGLALEYKDGTGVYALNGLAIPKEYEWVITDKAKRSDYKSVLDIRNVEIRTEVLKLFDADAIETNLPKKLVHEWTCEIGGNYKLYEVTFGTVVRKYLKMKCPSKGDTPFQAVHPDCKTCQDALSYREDKFMKVSYTPPLFRT